MKNFIRITTECCEKTAPDIYHISFVDKYGNKSPFTYPNKYNLVKYIDIFIDSMQTIKLIPTKDSLMIMFRFYYNNQKQLIYYEYYVNNKLQAKENLYDSIHKTYLSAFIYDEVINQKYNSLVSNENLEFENNRLIEERVYINYAKRKKSKKRKKILQSCYNYFYIPINDIDFLLNILNGAFKINKN